MAARPYRQRVFINLAVRDVEISTTFFTRLGYPLDPRFSDEETVCVTVSDTIALMLLHEEKFARFTVNPTADATRRTEALICLSARSREHVDELVTKAVAAGGSPAAEPNDLGFLYARSFLDPDGHHFEMLWMDPEAAQS